MKSDVIHVSNGGAGINEARVQAEKVSVFLGLDKKNTMHLVLLTEEMMGMMQALTGQPKADFWIESQQNSVALHLKVETAMNNEMRQKLLAVSTTGKNVSVKGFMGKIKDMFQRMIEPLDGNPLTTMAFAQGYDCTGGNTFSSLGSCLWSLRQYRASLKMGDGPKEDWDELEKSIVSKLADEVQIGIIDDRAEMIIYKNF